MRTHLEALRSYGRALTRRHGARASKLLLWLVVVLLARSATAGVRLEEDEVVFTLTAPAARTAFVVGDFNNWNPTLEKMEKVGDTFELRLFLLAGKYRYKFVVDGKWIVDPDVPGSDAKAGSPLVLEERGDALVFGDEEITPEGEVARLEPSLRYTGGFFLDEARTRADQTFDVFVGYASEKVRASVDFKTTSESWETSPARAEVDFNKGFVELRIGDALARGFENDSLWTSSDPFRVVGDVGIYDYNAGFERKGVSLELPQVLKTRLRATYADKIEAPPLAPVTIPQSAFGGFGMTATPDTTVYRHDTGFNDADALALDVAVDLGSVRFGYTGRENRGHHRGLLAEVTRGSGDFEVNAFNTREEWNVGVYWASWRFMKHLTAGAGFGNGDAHIRKNARSVLNPTALGDVVLGRETEGLDEEVPLQKSFRWHARLEYEDDPLAATVRWERTEFESEFPGIGKPEAVVDEGVIDVGYASDRWRVSGFVRYRDQDYGETPADVHIDTPTRNYWLDYRDRLDVPRMVTFDRARSTTVSAAFEWGELQHFSPRLPEEREPWGARVDAVVVTNELFGKIEHAGATLMAEYRVRRGLYAQAGGRVATYDKPSWDLAKTYAAPYVELGYRMRLLEASIGFGFDPVVLDPVINDYNDNGRQEFLRQAVFDGLTRDMARTLGERLAGFEQELEDFDALKLEVILYF